MHDKTLCLYIQLIKIGINKFYDLIRMNTLIIVLYQALKRYKNRFVLYVTTIQVEKKRTEKYSGHTEKSLSNKHNS